VRSACSILILVALVVSITAVGALAGPYTALVDPLESAGSTLAKTNSGVAFVPALDGNGAAFSGGGTKLIYDSSYFPSTGTVAFDVKPINGYYGTILDTIGTLSTQPGDFTVHYYATNNVDRIYFDMWDINNHFQRIHANMAPDVWSRVGISYSDSGIQLYINGQLEADTAGTFSRSSNADDVYLGDMDKDYYVPSALPGFVGYIDNLQTSNVGNDKLLISPSSVPEPGTLLVLLSGLASSALAFRKRRR
jgi:hypothetical protein